MKTLPIGLKTGKNTMYDFLIVGAGLFGSTIAREVTDRGYKCLVVDKRDHVGGNCYTENISGIDVHKYGAHIFHTDSKKIWDYVNQFSEFEQYQHNVIANYEGRLYNLPFNMWTFNQMWGVNTEEEVKSIIDSQRFKGEPKNLEEYALSVVGKDIYNLFIRGYTKKQWNIDPKKLPISIIKRIPIRFIFNNNYYNDNYQGIPKHGYTKLIDNLLDGIPVELGFDYFDNKERFLAKRIIYTGPIDKFYDYCYGKLDYRSITLETQILDTESYQGCSVMNFTSEDIPYTRIIEHKFFSTKKTDKTIISKEFSVDSNEPFYPIGDEKNMAIYNRYNDLNKGSDKYIFGGRLAEYRYYDMHQVIGSALSTVSKKIPF